MFAVRLQGGLGNQMFQYAMARALAERTGKEFRLDISFYKSQSLREYKLWVFNIVEKIASPMEIIWIKLLAKTGIWPSAKARQAGVYLDGYWQSEKYFKDIEGVIRREFVLKSPSGGNFERLAGEIGKVNSVSLHIRRGDYVSSKKVESVLGPLPLDYYREAVALIKNKVADPRFFIFSDDPDWVKNNLDISAPVTYVSAVGLKDYEELILMSLCKHNIIANSSFSWWGAWLNNNPNKIVIAPKRWFADSARENGDLVPERWIRI